jgi:hypothetical protein
MSSESDSKGFKLSRRPNWTGDSQCPIAFWFSMAPTAPTGWESGWLTISSPIFQRGVMTSN